MKKLLFALPCVALAACSNSGNTVVNNSNNPLFLERYAEEIVNVVTEMEIYQDEALEVDEIQEVVNTTRRDWLEVAKEARALQREGYAGFFQGMQQYAAGEVMYVDNGVHFAPLFETEPGPGLHVILTTALDPRDVIFPDETAVDLGPLLTPYGAQSYTVEGVSNPADYRTVALWDYKLNRLYGFAQLSRQ